MAIIDQVNFLVNSEASGLINARAEDFRRMGKSSKEILFGELCFCLLTANTSAELGIRTQEMIGLDGFLYYDEEKLRDELKRVKYRFYNVRSRFISQARWIIDELPGLMREKDRSGIREYLVENVKGIGYKEASHFLRNVGIFDFVILDKHILRMLGEEFGLEKLKNTPRKEYLKNEELVIDLSGKMKMEPGILDLYMWKIATGKILK